ncbi:transcriptional regulator [Allostella vacuolata]|nr:transcriptional regulator [Stella vacuolata]
MTEDGAGRDPDGEQVRSLSRAIALMRILGRADGASMRLTDIVSASGLHKATAHRILATLVREGLVQHDGREGYVLGPELFLLGAIAARRFDISAIARPILDRIARATGDVALLFVPSGANGVCVLRCEGTAPIIPGTTRVGTIKPLGVGAGCMALLMAADPDDAEEIIVRDEAARLTAWPGFDADHVRTQLSLSRERGFSFDEERITPGVRAVGVPVRDARGRLIAGLSCTAFAERMRPPRPLEMAGLLMDAAREITGLLGSGRASPAGPARVRRARAAPVRDRPPPAA